MFLVISLYTWIGVRFIRPDRSPIEICVGNSSYSCSDTGRIRVGALLAISLFVFRNIVIMLRHECRDSSGHFGGMRTQRFLLIKSAVILNADEIYVSTLSPASIEPEMPEQTASSAVSFPSSSKPSSSVHQPSDMRVVDMESESEPSSASDPLESSAIVRVIGVIPGGAFESHDQPQSATESSPIISHDASLSTPPAEVTIDAADSVAHNVQELTVFSMFGIDVDSRVRPQRMLFGTTMARLWQSQWFVAQFIGNLIAVVACFAMQEPNNSVSMVYIVFAIVALFFFQMSTLIDMRIMRHLVGAFEFWFLQVVNFVAFVTLCLNILKEADGVAEFTGRDRTIQFWFDICWNFVGFAGCAVVGVADALMIRRRLKIVLIAFWSLNLFREMWWWMWIKYQRSYTLPLDICISSECFSTQIIRLQTTMTFAIFSAKYAFSLVRYPHALVILKSTIVMGAPASSAGNVSCRADSQSSDLSTRGASKIVNEQSSAS
jgi:hypothetical protein